MFAGSVYTYIYLYPCVCGLLDIYTRLSRSEWTIKQTEDDSGFTHLQVRNLYTSIVWCTVWCLAD